MNTEKGQLPDYRSYLMRVWRAPGDNGPTWRASLEETLTQQVHGFKDLESLFAFLLAQTGQQGQHSASVRDEPYIANHEDQVETR